MMKESADYFSIMRLDTVNVKSFALYLFSRYLRFSNICENIYNLKITSIMP